MTSDDKTTECPDCHGDGVVNGKECKKCDGFGYLEDVIECPGA